MSWRERQSPSLQPRRDAWMQDYPYVMPQHEEANLHSGGGARHSKSVSNGGHCPRCGTTIPPDAPEGLCRKCLAKLVIADDSEPKKGADLIVGDYELDGEIASGGMGVVYRARQMSLNRVVALKMIRTGTFASKVEVHRFQTEAQAAGNLDHPNIVPIYEIGEADGLHYFSMKLIEGHNLADELQGRPMNPRRAAKLLIRIAHALHHAHLRGILHRDLKPKNILVDERGEPQVTDFGLAKVLAHETGITQSHDVMGTPSYMAPEQALGNSKEVTTAADVYSLGSIFYTMLTGRPPFLGNSTVEILRKVVQDEPQNLRAINAKLDRDVETICLKCLEKDPRKRYASAELLAEDLERWLTHEPISARPADLWERTGKWVRRHPATVVFMALLTAGLIAFVTLIQIDNQRIQKQRDRAVYQQRRAEAITAQLQLERAEDLFRAGDTGAALAHLGHALRNNPSNVIGATRLMSALTLRNFALPLAQPFHHDWAVIAARFSRGGTRAVTASWDKTVRIWSVREGTMLTEPLVHDNYVRTAEFSPEGERVLSAAEDNTVRIWNARNGQQLWLFRHDDKVWAAQFHPGGRLAGSASWDRTARLWDTQIGAPFGEPMRHNGRVTAIEFSPAADKVATACDDGFGRVWSVENQRLIATLPHTGAVHYVQFSRDGSQVVTAGEDHMAQIWRSANGERLQQLSGHRGPVLCARFSRDGSRVVTTSWDNTARLWNATNGQALCAPIQHEAQVGFADFSRDGARLVTVSWDKTARIWDGFTGKPISQPLIHNAHVSFAEFNAYGDQLITAAWDHRAQLWDVRVGHALPRILKHAYAIRFVQFSPNDERVVTASADRSARVWDTRSGAVLSRVRHQDRVVWAEFSPDNEYLMTASADGTAQICQADSGRSILTLKHGDAVTACQFSPSGRKALTVCADKHVRLWDGKTGELIHQFPHVAQVQSARFSPQGDQIVTACADNLARIWDTETGRMLSDRFRHQGLVDFAEFSPDGRMIVTAAWDSTARVWDAQSGKPVFAEPLRHQAQVLVARFSSDGRFVVTASRDKTARVWKSRTGELVCRPLRHDGPVVSASFTPDGMRVLTFGEDNAARLWDAHTGYPVWEPLQHEDGLTSGQCSPGGKRIVTASVDGVAKLWTLETPTEPPPAWLAELAEAIGGQRFTSNNIPEPVSTSELLRLKHRISAEKSTDIYTRWAQWLFSDRTTRPPSPFGEN